MKECKECKILKSLDSFQSRTGSKGKTTVFLTCKKCNNERVKAYNLSKRLENPEYVVKLEARKSKKSNDYRKHKGIKCEMCGFVPVHSSQLDVDHIDGDKYNNDIINLKTLCTSLDI